MATHSHLHLCLQTLQDKVCEFQARLRSEEVTRHLLLQQLQQQSIQEESSRRRGGVGGGGLTPQEEQRLSPPTGESRSRLQLIQCAKIAHRE